MGGGISGYGSGSGSKSSKINWDKQNRHDRSSKKYIKGKSYLVIPKDKLQSFVDTHLPNAKRVNDDKYRVHSKNVIGMYIDNNGRAHPTTNAIIVKSKTGSHIYPARPDNFKGE